MSCEKCQEIEKIAKFFYKIEFLRTNSYKMRKDSMKVTFEVDSTPLEDYLFIFDLVTELWLGQIMSSENAIFVKISIFDTRYLASRKVVNFDERHFLITIT